MGSASVNRKVQATRAKASTRFGCSAAAPLQCVPSADSGWWTCSARSTLLHRGSEAAPLPSAQTCNQALLLADIATALHKVLRRSCPLIDSAVCPSVGAGLCEFGVSGNTEAPLGCSKIAKEEASAKVKREVQKSRKYGCNANQQVSCERLPESRWLTCDFVGESPSSDNTE